jgi:hypothetical protein
MMSASRLMVCAVLAGGLVLGAGVAAAAQPQTSARGSASIPAYLPEVVLYDQNDNAATMATNSQDFEAANNAFDNELADDFVVPAGGWAIDNVTLTGLFFNGPGPAASVHVAFYDNAGTLPGAPVAACDYPAVVPASQPNFSLPLAPPCVLAPGTFWVSVRANMNFTPAGQWGWFDRLITANNPAAWRNPGGGFALPACVGFAPRGATCGIDAPAPDQMFTLSGVATPVELLSYGVE